MTVRLALWSLKLLALMSVSTARSPYYTELPEAFKQRFEAGDRYSTIVDFVREAVQNSSSDGRCLGSQNRSRFPLSAFQLPATADRGRQQAKKQPEIRYHGFDNSVRSVLSMANLFNYIYQLANRPFEDWFKVINEADGHKALWYSVASSIVASDGRIFGCYVVLLNGSSILDTVPHAYRSPNHSVLIENYAHLVSIAGVQRPGLLEPGFEWLERQRGDQIAQRVRARPSQRMRIKDRTFLQPFTSGLLRLLDDGGEVKVVTEAEGLWNPPVFVCHLGRWLFSYAVPFLSGQAGSLAVKGWIALEFDINELEINQCLNESTFGSFYSNNVCNQATTECHHIPGQGFSDANFMCNCRKYFHHGNFTGDLVRQQYLLHLAGKTSNYSALECGPCPPACPDSCTTDGRCLIKYDLDKLRAVPLIIQTFFLTICLLTAGIVFRARKNRVIKAAVWILLELFLLGVAMLYTTVFLMYLQPSYEICFMIPWFREIGFAVTYGTLVVKIYRILCSFQSRKAHRVHVRDRDLLKYLGGIVTVATGFMAAWTAATLDHSRRLADQSSCGQPALTGQLVLEDGQLGGDSEMGFRVCAIGYWEAVCAAGELVFLAFGLFYCYCIRSAPSDCGEVRCITAALALELCVSFAYHVARHFVRTTMHPDYVYLMYFGRCHATVTVTAALVMGPRLWYVHSPPRNSINSRSLMYSQVDANLSEAMNPMAIASNGDVEVLETNISEMNPEDIRAELKRLYTQLEILKTKVMRRENPHISKRKGGRKQTHRRTPSWRVQSFSLQPFYHKHKQQQQQQQQHQLQQQVAVSVHEEEASKVSEESSNSAGESQSPEANAN